MPCPKSTSPLSVLSFLLPSLSNSLASVTYVWCCSLFGLLLYRATTNELGLVLSPTKPNKKRKAPTRANKRKPEWTDDRMMAQFKDQNGDFQQLNHQTILQLVQLSGWSKSAIFRVQDKVKDGKTHCSKPKKPRRVPATHTEALADLCNQDENQVARDELENQLRLLAFNNHKNRFGDSKPFTPLSPSAIRAYIKEMELRERATNDMHTYARELAAACPYTFIHTAASFYALEQLYGVPSVAECPMQEVKIEYDQVGNLILPNAPEIKFCEEKKLNPAHTWYFDESMGKSFKISSKVMKKKGTQHVTGQKLQYQGLPQGYNLIWGCRGDGKRLPALVGFRCPSLEPGDIRIVRLPMFSHLSCSCGSYAPMVVFYNKKDAAVLPRLFRQTLLEPTIAEYTLDLVDGEMHLVFQDGGCNEHIKDVTLSPTY